MIIMLINFIYFSSVTLNNNCETMTCYLTPNDDESIDFVWCVPNEKKILYKNISYKMAKTKTQTTEQSKKIENKKEKKEKIASEPVQQEAVSKKSQKKVKKDEVVEQVKKEKKVKKAKRSFKAVYVNPEGEVVIEGRYCGVKPKQAGCKALTGIYKLFAKAKKNIIGEIYFGVYETTRGSRNKTYFYSGERVSLDEPVELQIGGKKAGETLKTITYKFNSNVKKAQESDCQHLANPKEVDNDLANVEDEEIEKPKKNTKTQKKSKAKAEPEPEPEPEPEVEAEPEPEAKKASKAKSKAEPKVESKKAETKKSKK